jgi:hypothetical protein
MVSFPPALVVGAWAGVLVGRWNFRAILTGANLAWAMLAAEIPLLFLASAALLAPGVIRG